jgi:hypothetical protein
MRWTIEIHETLLRLQSNPISIAHHKRISRPPYRRKLPQPHTSVLEHDRRCTINAVACMIDHLPNPHLGNLHTARQTRTCTTIQAGTGADPLSTGLKQGILLGMQTETSVKGSPRVVRGIAPQTASSIAIGQAARSAVVACTYDAELAYQNAAHSPFHTVTAVGGQFGQLHEVGVPGWAEAGLVREVERLEGVMEGGERRGRVEETKLGTVEERCEPGLGSVEVLIVSEDELG